MHASNLFVLLFSLLLIAHSLEYTNTSLSKLISGLIKKEDKLLIGYSSSQEDFVTDILKYPKAVTVVKIDDIFNAQDSLKNMEKQSFYLILPNSIRDFNIFLRTFYLAPGWNPRGKFLVVNVKQSESIEYFQMACWYLLSKFAVVDRDLNVYSHRIFDDISCKCSKIFKSTEIETIFPPMMETLKNYNGCPLKVVPLIVPPFVINVTSIRQPGIDIVMLREVSTRLNFTLRYVKNPHRHWGSRLPNGSVSRMYSMLASREADVMVGMVVTNQSSLNIFDAVEDYLQGYIAYHVPAALIMKPWKNLTMIFTRVIWILIVTSIACASLTFRLISKDRNFIEWVFTTLNALFSSPTLQPGTSLLRMVFLLWGFYSFVITATYQSILASFLAKPAYERQISTVEEMIESSLDYGGHADLRPLFLEPDNPTYMRIFINWKNCPITEECVNRSAYERNFGVLKNTRQVNYLTPKYYAFPSGEGMLYQFKQPINRFLVSCTFVKGFPLYDSFKRMILYMKENGLIGRWDKEQSNVKEYQGRGGGRDEPKVLTMQHLKIAFVVLVLGYGFSLSVFVIETRMEKRLRKIE